MIRGYPMNRFHKVSFLLILALGLGLMSACSGTSANQANTLANHEAALRTPPVELYPPPAPRTEGSLFSDSVRANLFTDVKAAAVGDIITINITETSKASKESKTTLGRDSGLKIGLSALLGYENRLGLPDEMKPSSAVDTDYNSDFKGTGKTSRNESMVAQISARVVQVLPNGNLVVRGSREITVNYEKQFLIVQGVVRPADISPDNTVQSNYIADAVIEYSGSGDLTDQQRKGWLTRVLDKVWPF